MNSKVVPVSQYFEVPNPGLSAYFARVRMGQPEVYRSTLYANKPIARVLFDWNKRLGTIASEWPSLYSFEMDMAKNVGPMSVMQPLAKRMSDIEHYYSMCRDGGKPLSSKAVQLCLKEWNGISSQPVHMLSQRETVERMKLSTNSGSPYFAKRRTVVEKTLPVTCSMQGEEVLLRQGSDYYKACAVLGWRGQEGGPLPEDVKQRVVWMFPFGVNVCEQQAYIPLISAFQFYNYVPAWNGNTFVDAEITKLFDTKASDDVIVCTDFSKFDQHFNRSLQDAAQRLISSLLCDSVVSNKWIEEIYPIKYMIPLMIDEGYVVTGNHGMGSGSGGTNFDETIAHRCLQYDAALRAKAQLNQHSMCLGDDGIISWPGITVDDVIKSYTSHGLEMQPKKQYVSTDDCVFLRRWHHKDYREGNICVGVYSTMRALGRLMSLERFHKDWDMRKNALRQLSILENVKYHPLKEEFVKFCMKGDKYRLGIDIPGFLANIQGEVQRAIDDMPDFFGYAQSLDHNVYDPDSWWIINYLRSLM
nr:MAG: RNA-dependent RNA polymerase [Porcine picobirnavirus]UAW00518.1 MAG: RNA-dependent RNA polymerase [Porcine picobirnavirus]